MSEQVLHQGHQMPPFLGSPAGGDGGPPEPAGRGRRVLLIEDEEVLGRNTKEYLEEVDGFEVRLRGDGEAGLAELEAFRPSLVLLDLRLPGMDGLAVLERLRGRHPGLDVIMMTSHDGARAAAEARRAGARTFLAKPLVLSELRRAVLGAL